jgi:hypothetical protein
MQNLPLCILIVVLVVIGFMLVVRENFSNSGLNISDDYCNKMADVYYDPRNVNSEQRQKYKQMICGKQRRNTIAMKTGNYFTQNGVLV